MSTKIIINSNEDGKKLGDVLFKRGVSRRLITRLKRIDGGIECNGCHIRTIDIVKSGDEITLNEHDEKTLEPNFDLAVEILYEDENLIVFNKPPLMPVHPSIKHQGDTLGNFFSAYCEGLTFRPVNRLDRDTSGCVIVAKNQYSAQHLQRSFEKTYYAICHGHPEIQGRIDLPIARESDSIIKRHISQDGQPSVTNYKIIGINEKYSLAKINLETGRTHQIRVHFSHIGFPLAGDDMYGGTLLDYNRQALHCKDISFISPKNGEKIVVTSDFPKDFKIETFGKID